MNVYSIVLLLSLLLLDATLWIQRAWPATRTSVRSGVWTDPATWGCTVPAAGDDVTVAPGHQVLYDVGVPSPAFRSVAVQGVLGWTANPMASREMRVGSLLVPAGGRLTIAGCGAQSPCLVPWPRSATASIVLIDAGQPDAPVLLVSGGTLELRGAPVQTPWTKLVADVPAGGVTVSTREVVADWPAGGRVLVTGTGTVSRGAPCGGDFADYGGGNISCSDHSTYTSEDAPVQAVDSFSLTLAAPLRFAHAGSAPPYRGEVGLLSRNVVVTSDGPRRGHVKIEQGGVGRLQWAEFRRLGVRGRPGHYPVHFHLLGNAGRQSLMEGVSAWDSDNLGIRIHGTNFLTVRRSVVYNVVGHGVSNEDGTEAWNTIEGTLVARTLFVLDPAAPDSGYSVNRNPNDVSDRNEGSCFWFSNGRNRLRGNVAVNCNGWGFDFDPVDRMVELPDEQGVLQPAVHARNVPILEFTDNEAHSGDYGGFNAGNEIVYLIGPPRSSVTRRFLAWRHLHWGWYSENALGLVVEDLDIPDETEYYAVFPYRAGEVRFVRARFGTLYGTGKRVWGSWILESATISGQVILPGGCLTGGPLIIVFRQVATPMIGFSAGDGFGNPCPAGSPYQPTVYWLHLDGPGRHVKFIHAEAPRPADGLAYAASPRVGLALEAPFTAATWPQALTDLGLVPE